MTGLRPVVAGLMEHAANARLVGGVFDVRRSGIDGEKIAARMVARSSFIFSRLPTSVAVSFADLPGTQELASADRRSGIALDNSVRAMPTDTAATILLEEVAHFVDWFLLTDDQRHAIADLYKRFGRSGHEQAAHGARHRPTGQTTASDPPGWSDGDYWDQIGESFMSGFVLAYSDFTPDQRGFRYRSTPEVVRGIRRVVGG